jgi:putative ATPase
MNGSDLLEEGGGEGAPAAVPLADRLRPRSLEEFVGQRHLLAPGRPLRRLIEEGKIPSMVLWGPPGSGKTTLARLLADHTGLAFESFSAVLSGVKEVREVVERARMRQRRRLSTTLLFVDEIHRFNKAQQDAFLPHVEAGLLVLVGSTTENPSFEVIAPLLSRVTVFTFEALTPDELRTILHRALSDPERGVRAPDGSPLVVTPEAEELLVALAGGDARTLLNLLEMAAGAAGAEVDAALVDELLHRRTLRHDKAGESHYNLISALHKAVRGSDADGALYWLARLLEGGEDPLFVARRVVRMAVEDVGLADPRALGVALQARDAYHFLGTPEGELALFQAVAYLAVAPKSNALYRAESAARRAAREEPPYPVPLAIRNAPTRLMEKLGYARGYRYDHEWPGALAPQTYLPPELEGSRFYEPTDRGLEARIAERLDWLRRRRAELLAAERASASGSDAGRAAGAEEETPPKQQSRKKEDRS